MKRRAILKVAWAMIALVGLQGVMVWCLYQPNGWIPGSIIFVCGGGSWAAMVAYFGRPA